MSSRRRRPGEGRDPAVFSISGFLHSVDGLTKKLGSGLRRNDGMKMILCSHHD
jgi:hypothetical protein